MDIQERRLLIQESFERLKTGERREDIFDYLLSKGLEKSDVSQILLGSEDRLRRLEEIKGAETNLSLPIVYVFFGIILLFVGRFLLYPQDGLMVIGALPLVALGSGLVLSFAGIITFILKLRNKLTKKY